MSTATRPEYLVLAGNRHAAEIWAKSRQLTRSQWRYASSARRFEGINNLTAVVLPSFAEKPDSEQIMQVVQNSRACGVTIMESSV